MTAVAERTRPERLKRMLATTPDNLIEYIVSRRLWGEEDLCLLDVGASGGIHQRWAVFGDRLTAVGFDPLISEVDRLNKAEKRPTVRYESAFVGCDEYDRLFPPEIRNDARRSRYNQPFERSSAVAACRILQRDFVQAVFNSGAPVEFTTRTVTLDQFLASSPHLRPDFLKIDTDGSDFQVLLGAATLLESPTLLGISIESQFHGAVHDYANVFSNIDRFLRQRGFTLFDLNACKYSRAELPAPFAISKPAQTVSGQVQWGDALYFRDLGQPLYEAQFGVKPTRERLLKLCCLFESHGLSDCAAEILITSEMLESLPERTVLLDLLTPRLFGDTQYDQYMARFNANPSAWLPRNLRRILQRAPVVASIAPQPAPGASGVTPAGAATTDRDEREASLRRENAELRELVSAQSTRIRKLKEQRSVLRERLERRERRLEDLKSAKK
ncbi:MAG TPA: FkbM family methyltransferase [Vicinamibacterales bacterium]